MGQTHRALREQLGAYALGHLPVEQLQALDAHLRVCAACRADLAEIAPVVGLLDGARGGLLHRLDTPAAEPAEVPPLPDALLAQVRGARSWAAPAEVAGGRGRQDRVLRLALVAAAAVIAVGGVGFVAGASATPSAPIAVGEAVAVRAVDQQVTASARLVAHTWGVEIKLTATGFRAGETYRVTVTDDAGRTVSAGEFVGTGTAEMACNLNSSVLRADASTFQVSDASSRVVLAAAL